MDRDGANHRFLTNGQNDRADAALRRRTQHAIVYMSYRTAAARESMIYDIGAGAVEPAAGRPMPASTSRRASRPTGADDPVLDVGGRQYRHLSRRRHAAARRSGCTNAPGIDTGGSYSPDGSQIVFESDRSRHPAALCDERRRIEPAADQLRRWPLRHAGVEPARRPDRLHRAPAAARSRIGVMSPGGGGEKLLTNGWGDEGPTWSPNGRVLMFFRAAQELGRAGPVVGRPDRRQCAQNTDAPRRLGSELGTTSVPETFTLA